MRLYFRETNNSGFTLMSKNDPRPMLIAPINYWPFKDRKLGMRLSISLLKYLSPKVCNIPSNGEPLTKVVFSRVDNPSTMIGSLGGTYILKDRPSLRDHSEIARSSLTRCIPKWTKSDHLHVPILYTSMRVSIVNLVPGIPFPIRKWFSSFSFYPL